MENSSHRSILLISSSLGTWGGTESSSPSLRLSGEPNHLKNWVRISRISQTPLEPSLPACPVAVSQRGKEQRSACTIRQLPGCMRMSKYNVGQKPGCKDGDGETYWKHIASYCELASCA